MIKQLYVKNYALIDKLHIDFSKGLTIITGETGAGKSILLGALGLVMGNRADTKALYDENQKCVVEARFDIGKYKLRDFFEANDLDYDEELLLRRELLPGGKSRAFINDTPVNLKILQELSGALIDLYQQFDTLDIHQVSFQLRLLDALAGNAALLDAYQERYRAFQLDQRRLRELEEHAQQATRELDFLRFQLEELRAAELRPGEQETLEAELSALTHAEEIKRTLDAACQRIIGAEDALSEQLRVINQALGHAARYDQRLGILHERLNAASSELEDLAREFERIAEATEYDPERIHLAQQRLDLIYRLEKKHQTPDVASLLLLQEDTQARLDAFTDLDGEIEKLRLSLTEQQDRLQADAERLSARRREVAPAFAAKVLEMLGQLAMEHARLQIDFKTLPSLGPTGIDEVNFLFAANPGSRLQLIKDVASGGELSRLNLAAKSLVASAIPLPTLIFDEIDSGVSGDIALKMGNILRQLSNRHQVVSITHSPQIAAKADMHYFVFKRYTEQRTITEIRPLRDEERVRAIATMLSQSPPSESAMENARELLNIA
jgi:DNA repair protein RecN (Recombination protein N)